jgi:hypothetical protein
VALLPGDVWWLEVKAAAGMEESRADKADRGGAGEEVGNLGLPVVVERSAWLLVSALPSWRMGNAKVEEARDISTGPAAHVERSGVPERPGKVAVVLSLVGMLAE